MTSKIPLSVFIIAKNEEDRIGYTINSVVDWVDEVIVVDSGSDDGTVELSERLGAKVVFNEWPGYGEQKIFAEQQCSNRWVLNLDADEEVSAEARTEILKLFGQPNGPDRKAYFVDIKTIKPTEDAPRRFAPFNRFIRLYHTEYGSFNSSTVHDVVDLREGVQAGMLASVFYHRCFRSYSHAVEKINYYTSMQAHDMLKRNRVPSIWRVVIEPFLSFFKIYILRKHVFLGVDGFQDSVMYVFARTIRLSKARELAKIESRAKAA